MLSDDVLGRLLQAYADAGKRHADAAGDLVMVAEFTKVKLATLTNQHLVQESSISKAELKARASQEYYQAIRAHGEAKANERAAAYLLREAEMRIDLLRTREASRRTEARLT